jgi:hypothetical protein
VLATRAALPRKSTGTNEHQPTIQPEVSNVCGERPDRWCDSEASCVRLCGSRDQGGCVCIPKEDVGCSDCPGSCVAYRTNQDSFRDWYVPELPSACQSVYDEARLIREGGAPALETHGAE